MRIRINQAARDDVESAGSRGKSDPHLDMGTIYMRKQCKCQTVLLSRYIYNACQAHARCCTHQHARKVVRVRSSVLFRLRSALLPRYSVHTKAYNGDAQNTEHAKEEESKQYVTPYDHLICGMGTAHNGPTLCRNLNHMHKLKEHS